MPPDGCEQFDLAVRIAHQKVEVRLGASASADEIAAVVEVLDDGSYRDSARRIASATAEETSDDRAVAEIEAIGDDSSLVRTPQRERC